MNVYEKIGRLIVTALEIGGIAVLAGMAIGAECKRHKTQCKLIDTEMLLQAEKINGVLKDVRIGQLEKELRVKQKGGLI